MRATGATSGRDSRLETSRGLRATMSLTLNRRRCRKALSVSNEEYSRLLKGFGDDAPSSEAT